MKINFFNLLILSYFLPYSLSLYSIFDELSFNLRDYRDSQVIYNNYSREGDSVIYKNNIILAPKLNYTHALIYSRHVKTTLTERNY